MGSSSYGFADRLCAVSQGQLDRRYVAQIWIVSENTEFMIGNKKDNLTIIYTPADNLKKTGDMEVGQVSFQNEKKGSMLLYLRLTSPSYVNTGETRYSESVNVALVLLNIYMR